MRAQRTSWNCGAVAIAAGAMYVVVAALLRGSITVPGGWRCVKAVEFLLVLQIVMMIAACVVWVTLLQSLKVDYTHISNISGWEHFPNKNPLVPIDNDGGFSNDDAETSDDYYAGWYGQNNHAVNKGITEGFSEIGEVGSGMVLFVVGLVVAIATLMAGIVAATRGFVVEPESMYSCRAKNEHENVPRYGRLLTQVADGIYEE